VKRTCRYLIVVLIATLFFCIAVGQEQEQDIKIIEKNRNQIIQLAKINQIALLKLAMKHYKKNVRDYQGTLYKQERIAGKLGKEQVISFKFKENPFSIFMQWRKNAGPIDRLLYVEGMHDNKMIVRPNGPFSKWIKSVKLDPNSENIRKTSLRTCNEFGFYRIMQEMLRIYKLAKNDLEVKSVTQKMTDGCRFVEMEVLLPANKKYQERRVIIQIHIEYLMPVHVASYDKKNKLIYRYIHKDLQFNTGLSNSDFTR